MILSDNDIPGSCFHPFALKQLNGASYDLLIGEGVELAPKKFLRSFTFEVVSIPRHLVGFVCGKSSWARDGLIVESAGLIDPGFEGQIVLELFNQSDDIITVDYGRRICQVYLIQLSSSASQDYKTIGHYYGQRGAKRSWWHDKEK
jgi:dCTP deaminase